MGYIYQNRSWLTKISLIAFSVLLSLSLANSSGAQVAKVQSSSAAGNISFNSVIISGQILNTKEELDSSALKIRIGQKGAWLGESGFLTLDATGNFSITIGNLQPETSYDYQIFDAAGNLAPAEILSFKTGALPLVQASLEVRPFSFSAHIVGWMVTPSTKVIAAEKEAPYQFLIEYGEPKPDGKNDFAFRTEPLTIDLKDGSFDVTIFELKPSTVYEYRLVNLNKKYNPSVIRKFQTAGEKALLVGSQVALDSGTSVRISGLVSNENPANLKLAIRYGTDDFDFEVSIPKIDLVGNFFDVPLTGLAPGTFYKYQIYDTEGVFEPAPQATFDTVSGARGSDGGGDPGIIDLGLQGSDKPKTGDSTEKLAGLKNPLGEIDTLAEFIKKVLDIVLMIGVPIVAIFIIYSGFLFVKARGNPGELETAKSTFLWTIVGAAILLASWILAIAICETVKELGESSTQCR